MLRVKYHLRPQIHVLIFWYYFRKNRSTFTTLIIALHRKKLFVKSIHFSLPSPNIYFMIKIKNILLQIIECTVLINNAILLFLQLSITVIVTHYYTYLLVLSLIKYIKYTSIYFNLWYYYVTQFSICYFSLQFYHKLLLKTWFIILKPFVVILYC